MSKIPVFVRSRLALRQQPFDRHPDANLLLAFSGQVLSAHARAALLAHLERCAACREILTLSGHESAMALLRPAKHGLAWRAWRWPMAATLAGLIVAAAVTPLWLETKPHRVQLPPPTPKLAEQPPSAPVVAKAITPAPPKKVPARAKRRVETPAVAQVDAPVLSAPQLMIPQMGFQRVLSLGFQSPETAQVSADRLRAALKTVLDESLARPAQSSVWRIEQNGLLSRSRMGQPWEPVRVDQHSMFYALSVDGADVWAGGTDGSLFHSMDDGLHWRQVEVYEGRGERLKDNITKIALTQQHAIEVTTSAGAVWTSSDGRNWRQR